jgi:hypothetical protein
MRIEKCWVFVDKDGTEKISNTKPVRRQFDGKRIFSIIGGVFTGTYSKNKWNKWCDGWSTDEKDFLPFMGTILPKGSVERLIGRKLYWRDEPVEVRF